MAIEDKYLDVDDMDNELPNEVEKMLYDDIEDAMFANDKEIQKLKQYQMIKFQRNLQSIIDKFKRINKNIMNTENIVKNIKETYMNDMEHSDYLTIFKTIK